MMVFFKSKKNILTHLKTLDGRRDLRRGVDGIDRYLPVAFCAGAWVLVLRSVLWSPLCSQYCVTKTSRFSYKLY